MNPRDIHTQAAVCHPGAVDDQAKAPSSQSNDGDPTHRVDHAQGIAARQVRQVVAKPELAKRRRIHKGLHHDVHHEAHVPGAQEEHAAEPIGHHVPTCPLLHHLVQLLLSFDGLDHIDILLPDILKLCSILVLHLLQVHARDNHGTTLHDGCKHHHNVGDTLVLLLLAFGHRTRLQHESSGNDDGQDQEETRRRADEHVRHTDLQDARHHSCWPVWPAYQHGHLVWCEAGLSEHSLHGLHGWRMHSNNLPDRCVV
mmetsp:Transcript_40257/g.93628  ORF Transcript_40257/g.93628 Transcript_40257/m.93628 type:complete len:255 (+) Transcript_40257:148-912(+)